MAEIVNLNKARKAAKTRQKRVEADRNTLKFGRTKTERSLEQARAEKAARLLDGARREDDPS